MKSVIIGNAHEDNPDHVGGRYDPYHLAKQSTALEYPEAYDDYAELRAQGVPADLALIEAFEMLRFGMELNNLKLIELAVETNPYFKRRYKEVLAAKDIKRDLWTQNESVNQLLRIVKDPRTRDATRLNAIVHLNVMCKYVELDELTTRRVDKTIAEFQRQHAAWQAAGSPTQPASVATH